MRSTTLSRLSERGEKCRTHAHDTSMSRFRRLLFLLATPVILASMCSAQSASAPSFSNANESPRTKSPTLLISLVKDLNEVTTEVWTSLLSLCSDRPMIISILFSNLGSEKTETYLEAVKASCSRLILVSDSLALDRKSSLLSPFYQSMLPTTLNSRIRKLGYLRAWFSDYLTNNESLDVSNLSSVLVVDLDILSFPSSSSLSHAISKVESTPNGSVVCANGYERWLLMRHYYDAFALILKNGDFMFYRMTRATGLLLLLQHRFYNQVSKMDTNFPVQSCFGGLAVYSPLLFFDSKCSYAIQGVAASIRSDLELILKQYSDPQGDTCEHTVMNLCLNLAQLQSKKKDGSDRTSIASSRNALDISIQPDLLISRDANIFGALNNPTLVYTIMLLLLLNLVLISLLKSNLLPGWAKWRIRIVWSRFKRLVGQENSQFLRWNS